MEEEMTQTEETTEEAVPQQEAEPQKEPQKDPQAESGFPDFAEHIRGLESQAQTLQAEFPDFDLRQELCNPVFLQLTAPGTGISVADAYYALHRQQIQQAAAQETREKVVKSIQSGSRRPMEAGTDSQAPSLTTFRYGSATREQRDAFKKELHRAWGRGETVYPGR